ncbi:MAG: hypothetical protein H0X66_11730 [Verrucomicrobia bacterium]|nr:hypothetical protein [Verrucomicrobiota bacterium]
MSCQCVEQLGSFPKLLYMGLLNKDGTPKCALQTFADLAPDVGICQWFHYEDHRLDEAVKWLKKIGVKHVRTGLSRTGILPVPGLRVQKWKTDVKKERILKTS